MLKIKCNRCGKGGKLTAYMTTDNEDRQTPIFLHDKCYKETITDALKALYGIKI
jgi:hypothetical protein